MPLTLVAFLLAGQAAPPAPLPKPPTIATVTSVEKTHYDQCVEMALRDAGAALAEAARWKLVGGNFLAKDCAGMAYAHSDNWKQAADEFESAAKSAEIAKDMNAANYWAQAGNAWLAAGDPVKARAAIDAALASGVLSGLERGEAELDRARALVASGHMTEARADLDHALVDAANDPLSWLLSATLARRMGDLDRARGDIAEALKRSPDDAQVQLEAGNIAAASGEENFARAAWSEAARLSPDSPAGKAAAKALEQFRGQ